MDEPYSFPWCGVSNQVAPHGATPTNMADDHPGAVAESFLRLAHANDYRDRHEDALHADDNRSRKTVQVREDREAAVGQLRAEAQESRAEQTENYGQEALTDAEVKELRERDTYEPGKDRFKARSVKAILEAEGVSWMDHFNPEMTVDEHRDAVAEFRGDVASGGGGLADATEEELAASRSGHQGGMDSGKRDAIEDERERQQGADAAKARAEGLKRAREACDDGERAACDALVEEFGYDEATALRLLGSYEGTTLTEDDLAGLEDVADGPAFPVDPAEQVASPATAEAWHEATGTVPEDGAQRTLTDGGEPIPDSIPGELQTEEGPNWHLRHVDLGPTGAATDGIVRVRYVDPYDDSGNVIEVNHQPTLGGGWEVWNRRGAHTDGSMGWTKSGRKDGLPEAIESATASASNSNERAAEAGAVLPTAETIETAPVNTTEDGERIDEDSPGGPGGSGAVDEDEDDSEDRPATVESRDPSDLPAALDSVQGGHVLVTAEYEADSGRLERATWANPNPYSDHALRVCTTEDRDGYVVEKHDVGHDWDTLGEYDSVNGAAGSLGHYGRQGSTDPFEDLATLPVAGKVKPADVPTWGIPPNSRMEDLAPTPEEYANADYVRGGWEFDAEASRGDYKGKDEGDEVEHWEGRLVYTLQRPHAIDGDTTQMTLTVSSRRTRLRLKLGRTNTRERTGYRTLSANLPNRRLGDADEHGRDRKGIYRDVAATVMEAAPYGPAQDAFPSNVVEWFGPVDAIKPSVEGEDPSEEEEEDAPPADALPTYGEVAEAEEPIPRELDTEVLTAAPTPWEETLEQYEQYQREPSPTELRVPTEERYREFEESEAFEDEQARESVIRSDWRESVPSESERKTNRNLRERSDGWRGIDLPEQVSGAATLWDRAAVKERRVVYEDANEADKLGGRTVSIRFDPNEMGGWPFFVVEETKGSDTDLWIRTYSRQYAGDVLHRRLSGAYREGETEMAPGDVRDAEKHMRKMAADPTVEGDGPDPNAADVLSLEGEDETADLADAADVAEAQAAGEAPAFPVEPEGDTEQYGPLWETADVDAETGRYALTNGDGAGIVAEHEGPGWRVYYRDEGGITAPAAGNWYAPDRDEAVATVRLLAQGASGEGGAVDSIEDVRKAARTDPPMASPNDLRRDTGIKGAPLKALAAHYGTPEAALRAGEDELATIPGVGPATVRAVQDAAADPADEADTPGGSAVQGADDEDETRKEKRHRELREAIGRYRPDPAKWAGVEEAEMHPTTANLKLTGPWSGKVFVAWDSKPSRWVTTHADPNSHDLARTEDAEAALDAAKEAIRDLRDEAEEDSADDPEGAEGESAGAGTSESRDWDVPDTAKGGPTDPTTYEVGSPNQTREFSGWTLIGVGSDPATGGPLPRWADVPDARKGARRIIEVTPDPDGEGYRVVNAGETVRTEDGLREALVGMQSILRKSPGRSRAADDATDTVRDRLRVDAGEESTLGEYEGPPAAEDVVEPAVPDEQAGLGDEDADQSGQTTFSGGETEEESGESEVEQERNTGGLMADERTDTGGGSDGGRETRLGAYGTGSSAEPEDDSQGQLSGYESPAERHTDEEGEYPEGAVVAYTDEELEREGLGVVVDSEPGYVAFEDTDTGELYEDGMGVHIDYLEAPPEDEEGNE